MLHLKKMNKRKLKPNEWSNTRKLAYLELKAEGTLLKWMFPEQSISKASIKGNEPAKTTGRRDRLVRVPASEV